MRGTLLICAMTCIAALAGGSVEAQNRSRREGSLFSKGLQDALEKRRNRGRQNQNSEQAAKQPAPNSSGKGGQPQAKGGLTLANDPNDGQFQPKPDMMITSLINQGNMAQIFVANVGKFRSPPTTVELSIFRRGGGLLRKLTFRVGPLDVGRSSRLRAHSLPLNNVVVVARADPNNQMEEIREDNNGVSMSIGDQLAQAADLAVTKIEFVRNAKEVWVTVHNYGRSAVTQEVPLSLVSHFGLGPGQRQLHTVKNLKPNLFQTFRFKPDRFNSGMQFEAEVDPNNDLPELSKANNRRTATLR